MTLVSTRLPLGSTSMPSFAKLLSCSFLNCLFRSFLDVTKIGSESPPSMRSSRTYLRSLEVASLLKKVFTHSPFFSLYPERKSLSLSCWPVTKPRSSFTRSPMSIPEEKRHNAIVSSLEFSLLRNDLRSTMSGSSFFVTLFGLNSAHPASVCITCLGCILGLDHLRVSTLLWE